MKQKRLIGRSFVLFLLFFSLVYVSKAYTLEELRVPVASPASITSLAENVAVYRGFFKDIGYDARIYSASGGEAAVVLAMEKGDIPFFVTDDNMPLAIRPKSNIKIVAGTLNKLPYFLAAGKDVKSYKDLPQDGIKVGISSPTSGNVYVSLKLLEKNGIKNPRLIKVGGSTARLAAVKAGKVDVGSLTLGPMLRAKEAGLTILGSAGEVFEEFLMMQVGMSKKWIDQNPQKAVEVVGTMIRACEYINSNREGTIEVLTKGMKNKPEIAKQIYDIGVVQEKAVPRYCQLSEKGIQEYLKSARWSKAIDPNMKIPPTSEFTLPDLYQKGLEWYKSKHGS